MKKLVKNIVFIVFPFAVVVMICNYVIDAGNVFNNGKYEAKITSILLKKHNAIGLFNFDERLVIKNIFTAIDTAPNVVIIGTSKVLGFSKNNFPNNSFRNCALSKSTINDVIAEIGLFDSLHKFPKHIYIETSPFLNAKTDQDTWLTLAEFHSNFINKLKIKNIETINNPNYYFIKRKLGALTSLEYFQKSLSNYKKSFNKKIIETDTNLVQSYGRYADGSISYAKEFMVVDTAKQMANAKIFVSKEGNLEISEIKLQALKIIVNYLKTKNVYVSLIMMPLQQDCYTLYNENNLSIDGLKNRFIDFAKENKIELIGSFNPKEINLFRSDFYDHIHCKSSVLNNVLHFVQYSPN